MNFRPIEDKVLVLREEIGQTASGIILPEKKEKSLKGKVVAVSKEVDGINVGEDVVFSKYSGNDIEIDNIKYLILAKHDIAGIIDPE